MRNNIKGQWMQDLPYNKNRQNVPKLTKLSEPEERNPSSKEPPNLQGLEPFSGLTNSSRKALC